MQNNEFLVSVANAVLRDPNTGAAIAFGTTNLNSAFTLSMAKTDVRAGINNPLLYQYIHDRNLEIKIEEATFNSTILALNAGTSVLNSAVNVTQTDCLTLSGDTGTITKTPIGNVTVFMPNGTIQTVTPSTKTITVSGGNSQVVNAVYITSVTSDQIIIETTKPPSVIDLTLIAEVRDNTNTITSYLQINVPRFQIAGNYTLSLTANGVSNQALDGVALATRSADCVSGDYYAKVTWVPATTSATAVSDIAATPTVLTFSIGSGLPQSKQITVLGIRGGLLSNVNVTTSSSYVKTSGSAALTVSAGGLVTAGSATTAGLVGLIGITYYDATSGSVTDTVNIVTTA